MKKIALGVAAWIGLLALLHFKPWRKAEADPSRPTLEVGYLPVT